MRNDFNRHEGVNYSQVQMELLEVLLSSDDAPYPWDTTAPESEIYFISREQEFLLDEWSETAMAALEEVFLA